MPYAREHELIDVGDHRVAYRRIGTGPDLVFLHGWPLFSATWRNVVAELEHEFTCHLFDFPGAGDTTSTDPAATPAFAANAEVAIKAIDILGLTRFSLVGQDSGGFFARKIAATRPDQVKALIIMGSEIPGHTPWQVRLLKLTGKLPASHLTFSAIVNNRLLRRLPFALGGCFGDMANADGEFAATMLAPFKDASVIKPQIALLRNFDLDHFDELFDVHPLITAPTLMIWGEDDPFFPVAKARAMATQFGGEVTFETIRQAKLFIHEEYPQRVASLTADFVVKALARRSKAGEGSAAAQEVHGL